MAFRPIECRLVDGQVAAPTVNEDENNGYLVGDVWIDETNDKSYILVDKTAGAAVWLNLTSAAAGSVTLDVTNFDGILGAGDTDVQTAMETLDDHLHAGQVLENDGITPDSGTLTVTGTTYLTGGFLGIGVNPPVYDLHAYSTTSSHPIAALENVNDDNSGPQWAFIKKSGSPADDDQIGKFSFYGYDTVSQLPEYCRFEARSVDVSNGAEAGAFSMYVTLNGVIMPLFTISGYNGTSGQGYVEVNTGILGGYYDVDFIVNATGVANALLVRGSDGAVIVENSFSITNGNFYMAKAYSADANFQCQRVDLDITGTHTAARAIYGQYTNVDANVDRDGYNSDVYAQANFCHSESLAVNNLYGTYQQVGSTGGDVDGNIYSFYNHMYWNAGAGKTLAGSFGSYIRMQQASGAVTVGTAYYAEFVGTFGTAIGINISGEDYNQFSGSMIVKGDYLTIGLNDAQYGRILLYGHTTGSANGGSLFLYLAADYDNPIENYSIQIYQDDLQIGPNTDTDALKLDSNKDFYITAGNLTVAGDGTFSGGNAYAGVHQTIRGTLYAYGNNTTSGGRVRIYPGDTYDDNILSWYIQAVADDLQIGHAYDTDMLKLTYENDLHITAGNLVVGAASPLTNGTDVQCLGDGAVTLKETSTPTADTNYGKVYCKDDNKLYFQDGAGGEHEIAFV